jgi:hypothetical protein
LLLELLVDVGCMLHLLLVICLLLLKLNLKLLDVLTKLGVFPLDSVELVTKLAVVRALRMQKIAKRLIVDLL